MAVSNSRQLDQRPTTGDQSIFAIMSQISDAFIATPIPV